MRVESFTYFYPEKPGLLHVDQALIGILAANPEWTSEPKYNGNRLELHRLPSGAWEFWNRHGEKFSFTPNPELTAGLAVLASVLQPGTYNLFDCELRNGKTKGVRNMIVIYDIHIFAGELLTGIPFRQRRATLERLAKAAGLDDDDTAPLALAPQFPGNFREVFYHLIADPEIEGLVMKNLNGVLNLGRKRGANSAWMMKIRRPSNSYHF